MGDLCPLLAELQTRITTNPSSSIVVQMQNPLTVFRSTMETFTEKLRPGDGALSKVSKQLSWSTWSKSEAKEYLVKFEQFKSLLQSWLLLDLWWGTSHGSLPSRSLRRNFRDMGQEQRKEHGGGWESIEQRGSLTHLRQPFSRSSMSNKSLMNVSPPRRPNSPDTEDFEIGILTTITEARRDHREEIDCKLQSRYIIEN
jgi:hypothetical protein